MTRRRDWKLKRADYHDNATRQGAHLVSRGCPTDCARSSWIGGWDGTYHVCLMSLVVM